MAQGANVGATLVVQILFFDVAAALWTIEKPSD
jgi:hypothetical protein